MKILFLSAEVAPFAKTGGLGDVGGSLPKALRKQGHDVRVAMPAYGMIEEAIQSGRWQLSTLPGNLRVNTGYGAFAAGVLEGKLPDSDVPIYFVAERNLLGRGSIYGYDDDPYRFSFFSLAALELAVALGWRPDIVHAHDWHTAPAITWLATAGQADDRFRGIPGVFTIHNLAHQGRTPWEILHYLGVVTHSLREESYGQVNFMARGIYHARVINTVSPTYANEIKTTEGGAGLNGLINYRANDLYGILNGLDFDEWDPSKDSRIAASYDQFDVSNKLINKRALQAKAGLPVRDEVPLVAMITRLDWQKGLDITGHVIHLLLNSYAGEAQFVVLGSGAPEYERMMADFAGYHREKMTAFLYYDAALAPLIYAGSDMFLMPSLFEPCGLGQLIAMRYGSVPIVRATGGLADTVQDGTNGFTFSDYSSDAFWNAVSRALRVYYDDGEWQRIQQRGMAADFSWDRSAAEYARLYQAALS